MPGQNHDISIVTGFFDIKRGGWKAPGDSAAPASLARSTETYLGYFEYMAQIDNEMIIYTSPDLAGTVEKLRDKFGKKEKTKVVAIPDFVQEHRSLHTRIKRVLSDYRWHQLVENPTSPEHWNAEWTLIMALKAVWVSDAIDRGLVSNETVAWIDFGYCRNPYALNETKKWQYDFDERKIHLFNLKKIEPERPVLDVILTGDVYIMGCHLVAHRRLWPTLRDLTLAQLNKLLDCGLCDDDQTLFLMAYLDKPEAFELHLIDKHKGGWFVIFKLFNQCATAQDVLQAETQGRDGIPAAPGQVATRIKIEKPVTFKDCFRSLEQTIRLFRKRIMALFR